MFLSNIYISNYYIHQRKIIYSNYILSAIHYTVFIYINVILCLFKCMCFSKKKETKLCWPYVYAGTMEVD